MAWESLGGCTQYVKGTAVVKNALPAQRPFCQYCQSYCRYEPAYDRYSCRITGEWLLNIAKERGGQCPFDWKGEEDG